MWIFQEIFRLFALPLTGRSGRPPRADLKQSRSYSKMKIQYNKIPPYLTVWGLLMSFAEDLIILKWILEQHLSWNIHLLNTFSELPVLHLLLICDVMHTTKPRCCNGATTLILWTLTETTCATATRNWLFQVGKFRRGEHRKHGDADRKWDELQWQKQVEVKWMMSCC